MAREMTSIKPRRSRPTGRRRGSSGRARRAGRISPWSATRTPPPGWPARSILRYRTRTGRTAAEGERTSACYIRKGAGRSPLPSNVPRLSLEISFTLVDLPSTSQSLGPLSPDSQDGDGTCRAPCRDGRLPSEVSLANLAVGSSFSVRRSKWKGLRESGS